MLKEIHEQADAVAETIADRTVRPDGVDLPELDDELLRGVKRIIIVACGTSYHAGLIGRYAIEEWARVPVEMDVASEYRYRNPVVGPGDLVIGITQSGETLDTLAAMRLARERGATVLAVTNIMGSQATRDADARRLHPRRPRDRRRRDQDVRRPGRGHVPARAAPGRAARARSPSSAARELVTKLKRIPHDIGAMLEHGTEAIDRVAERHYEKDFFLYLGRHVGLPVGLEGALKLKEISYIATDAYAAGEMKHGPIALLDQDTPVVVVATDSPVLEKVISNMQEVRVRGAHVIAVASEGTDLGEHAEETLVVPRDRLDAPAAARGHPAAAAGLPDRAPARAERRSAAQPGEDRHGRVVTSLASAAVAAAHRRPPSSSAAPRGQHELRAGGDQLLRRGVGLALAGERDAAHAGEPLVGGEPAQQRGRGHVAGRGADDDRVGPQLDGEPQRLERVLGDAGDGAVADARRGSRPRARARARR